MAIITTPTYVCDVHGKSCTGGEIETYRFVGTVTETITKVEEIQTGTKKSIVNDEVVETPVYEDKETTETVTRQALLEKELCLELRQAHQAATALLGDQDNREIRSLPTTTPKAKGAVQPTLPGTGDDISSLKLGGELTEEIRVWAKGKGIDVKERGALKGAVKEAFFKEHPEKIPA